MQALVLDLLDDAPAALEALRRALTLADPEGYVRLFVDEGPPMARLLYQIAEQETAPHTAKRLLAAFPEPEPAPSDRRETRAPRPEMIEPLSERELEVLELVAQGLTNREIARRLYLSPHTIRAHTSNIYGKLGVGNRTEAVVKARALGVLPPPTRP